MAFSVIVMRKEEFAQWLDAQRLARAGTRRCRGDAGRDAFLIQGLLCVSHHSRHIRVMVLSVRI